MPAACVSPHQELGDTGGHAAGCFLGELRDNSCQLASSAPKEIREGDSDDRQYDAKLINEPRRIAGVVGQGCEYRLHVQVMTGVQEGTSP